MEKIQDVLDKRTRKVILAGAPALQHIDFIPRIHTLYDKEVLLRYPDIAHFSAYEPAVVDLRINESRFGLSCGDICVLSLAFDIMEDQMHLVSDILEGIRIGELFRAGSPAGAGKFVNDHLIRIVRCIVYVHPMLAVVVVYRVIKVSPVTMRVTACEYLEGSVILIRIFRYKPFDIFPVILGAHEHILADAPDLACGSKRKLPYTLIYFELIL